MVNKDVRINGYGETGRNKGHKKGGGNAVHEGSSPLGVEKKLTAVQSFMEPERKVKNGRITRQKGEIKPNGYLSPKGQGGTCSSHIFHSITEVSVSCLILTTVSAFDSLYSFLASPGG